MLNQTLQRLIVQIFGSEVNDSLIQMGFNSLTPALNPNLALPVLITEIWLVERNKDVDPETSPALSIRVTTALQLD